MSTQITEDMGAGILRINKDDDGDVGVVVIDRDGRMVDLEFCSTGSGGGQCPNTIAALRNLADAIEQDNKLNIGE